MKFTMLRPTRKSLSDSIKADKSYLRILGEFNDEVQIENSGVPYET
jgi:hypothetical protein